MQREFNLFLFVFCINGEINVLCNLLMGLCYRFVLFIFLFVFILNKSTFVSYWSQLVPVLTGGSRFKSECLEGSGEFRNVCLKSTGEWQFEVLCGAEEACNTPVQIIVTNLVPWSGPSVLSKLHIALVHSNNISKFYIQISHRPSAAKSLNRTGVTQHILNVLSAK